MSGKEINVWLVEDNTDFRRTVCRVINRLEGVTCEEAFSSAEELELAISRGHQPDVLLLDVQLPGRDGITALSDLRKSIPGVQSIVLTAFDDTEKIFRAICAGAAGYILKSSSVQEIGDAIRQVCDGGAPMSPSVARKVLQSFVTPQGPPQPESDYDLTGRERDILRLLADGLIKKEIADHLDISVHTVSTHIRSIYEKLHVNTNTGAVAKALREDLI